MRLADRQGLLTGQLNLVQTLGLRILMMLDAQIKSEDFWREFRARLGASNPLLLPQMFPEVFPAEAETKAKAIDEQARGEDGKRDFDRIDESQIVWSVPETDAEREDLERFIAANLHTTHTATATEIGGEHPWQ